MTDANKDRHDFAEPSGLCRKCKADWTDANPCGQWLKREAAKVPCAKCKHGAWCHISEYPFAARSCVCSGRRAPAKRSADPICDAYQKAAPR